MGKPSEFRSGREAPWRCTDVAPTVRWFVALSNHYRTVSLRLDRGTWEQSVMAPQMVVNLPGRMFTCALR